MKERKITRSLLRSWHACWKDEDIAAVVPKTGLTVPKFLGLREVSARDKVWVLCHLVSSETAYRFAEWCASRMPPQMKLKAAGAADAAIFSAFVYGQHNCRATYASGVAYWAGKHSSRERQAQLRWLKKELSL